MPTVVIDKTLEIEHPAGWTVLKWDDTEAYLEGIQKLPGSKAVDLLVMRGAPYRDLLMVEAKDFSAHQHENQDRVGDKLAIEVGHKVRDTIAALVAVRRCADEEDPDRRWAERLIDPEAMIRVVLLLEEAPAQVGAYGKRRNALRGTQGRKLKNRLAWLGRGNLHVLVCDTSDPRPFLAVRRVGP